MKSNRDFIFGTRAVIEAIRSGNDLEKILIARKTESEILKEIFSLARDHDIPYQYVPWEKLNKITRKNHQGVVALISPIVYFPMDELIQRVYERGEDPLFLILDQVSDVRNFGSVCRSAECLGFNGVIIPEKGSARVNADAVKTSAGALLKIPVSRVRSLPNSIKQLKDSGLRIIAVSEKAETILFESRLIGPLGILLGNEETGITDNLLFLSDEKLRIPMRGETESLNVSVAASIMMYEAIRQRSS